MAKVKLTFDKLEINGKALTRKALVNIIRDALEAEIGFQDELHNKGLDPAGRPQKRAKVHGNKRSQLHSGLTRLRNRSTNLGGALRGSKHVKNIPNGGEIRFGAGLHPDGSSFGDIALGLQQKGFKHTFLDEKGVKRVLAHFSDHLDEPIEKLVTVKKGV